MDLLATFASGVPLPPVYRVDTPAAVVQQVGGPADRPELDGQSIRVVLGSRGIARADEIARAVARYRPAPGGRRCIVPVLGGAAVRLLPCRPRPVSRSAHRRSSESSTKSVAPCGTGAAG